MRANPSFSQAELATLPVLDFKTTSPTILAEAYEQTRYIPVKPWKNAADEDMRERLDRAAAHSSGIALETIRDLRVQISTGPSLTNELAAEKGRGAR